MIRNHKIKTPEDIQKFMGRITNYAPEDIECTPHAFFRLNQRQRELFKCEQIKEYLLEKTPIPAGIQNNGNFTAFYKHENQRTIRIIFDIKSDKIKIVTFYLLKRSQIPYVRT